MGELLTRTLSLPRVLQQLRQRGAVAQPARPAAAPTPTR
jgi:hypothetical protein